MHAPPPALHPSPLASGAEGPCCGDREGTKGHLPARSPYMSTVIPPEGAVGHRTLATGSEHLWPKSPGNGCQAQWPRGRQYQAHAATHAGTRALRGGTETHVSVYLCSPPTWLPTPRPGPHGSHRGLWPRARGTEPGSSRESMLRSPQCPGHLRGPGGRVHGRGGPAEVWQFSCLNRKWAVFFPPDPKSKPQLEQQGKPVCSRITPGCVFSFLTRPVQGGRDQHKARRLPQAGVGASAAGGQGWSGPAKAFGASE